jgi:hypothetical protein
VRRRPHGPYAWISLHNTRRKGKTHARYARSNRTIHSLFRHAGRAHQYEKCRWQRQYRADLSIATKSSAPWKARFWSKASIASRKASLSANLCNGLYTHYKRQEDVSMESGKFDEELKRMKQIVDQLSRDALVLFNESFSSTTEREGSEIARQVVQALLDRVIKVLYVSHQFEFSHGFYVRGMKDVLFLRAERRESGERTFKLEEGGAAANQLRRRPVSRDIHRGRGTGRRNRRRPGAAGILTHVYSGAMPSRCAVSLTRRIWIFSALTSISLIAQGLCMSFQ